MRPNPHRVYLMVFGYFGVRYSIFPGIQWGGTWAQGASQSAQTQSVAAWSGHGASKVQYLVCTAGPFTGSPPCCAGAARDRVPAQCFGSFLCVE